MPAIRINNEAFLQSSALSTGSIKVNEIYLYHDKNKLLNVLFLASVSHLKFAMHHAFQATSGWILLWSFYFILFFFARWLVFLCCVYRKKISDCPSPLLLSYQQTATKWKKNVIKSKNCSQIAPLWLCAWSQPMVISIVQTISVSIH